MTCWRVTICALITLQYPADRSVSIIRTLRSLTVRDYQNAKARMNYGWGDSELRRTIDEIADMVAAKDGIAELPQEVNIDIVTRTGLTDDLTTDQDDSIIKRYELFSLMKSTINMALLDGDEKLDRQTLQLGGALSAWTFMTWISGAARMPATKIFGKSPAGNECHWRIWHENVLRPDPQQATRRFVTLDASDWWSVSA